jgi:hypothetical protein
MIYSDLFDALQPAIRERVYSRLYDVLTGKDPAPAYARLSASDRKAVLEIVASTKLDVPAYWTAAD